MSALISIGGARLKTIGLNPGRVSTRGEARVPGTATWYDMDHQLTGRGERVTAIEARTLPHVIGGLDAVQLLWTHLESNAPVNYIRMGSHFLASVLGQVVVRSMEVDEERLHPVDGVGRIVDVRLELVHVTGRGAFGGFA